MPPGPSAVSASWCGLVPDAFCYNKRGKGAKGTDLKVKVKKEGRHKEEVRNAETKGIKMYLNFTFQISS